MPIQQIKRSTWSIADLGLFCCRKICAMAFPFNVHMHTPSTRYATTDVGIFFFSVFSRCLDWDFAHSVSPLTFWRVNECAHVHVCVICISAANHFSRFVRRGKSERPTRRQRIVQYESENGESVQISIQWEMQRATAVTPCWCYCYDIFGCLRSFGCSF